jgi:hypothetical protein
MLDVHPAHHAATWRDFFIHIATIALGLLLAVGLERGVEVIHHRHEANHARELIAEEMAKNLALVQMDRYSLVMHEDYLFKDLLIIERIRRHALAPGDRVVLFHPYVKLANSAWQTAHESQLLALLAYDEVQRDARVYQTQDEYADTMYASTNALQYANTMRYHTVADRFDFAKSDAESPILAYYGKFGDARAHAAFENQAPNAEELARFAPAQIDRLEEIVQRAIYEDERLINRCYQLEDSYKSILRK